MKTYLVESYVARSSAALEASREKARATAELSVGVRYVRTTFLPTDEIALHLFEAPSVEALDRAGRLASLQFERILDAVDRSACGAKEEER